MTRLAMSTEICEQILLDEGAATISAFLSKYLGLPQVAFLPVLKQSHLAYILVIHFVRVKAGNKQMLNWLSEEEIYNNVYIEIKLYNETI